ncbi:MAG: response regulator [Chitinophagaceae bacterium]|nr:response regulator [Chitinophagaceae bacterium]
MKTLIIDDEANSRNTLRNLLTRLCPDVEILAEATRAEEGLALIRLYKPDLIFLDIEMPGKNGFDLISALQPESISVIFTTAFHQYAVKAFRFSAIDFLLKPIDPDELVQAVDKFKKSQNQATSPEQLSLLTQLWEKMNDRPAVNRRMDQKLALSNQDGIHIVNISDIVWCEALGSYTRIYFSNKSNMVVSRIIKEFEEMLSEYHFIRVHNAYLVNAHCIVRYIKGDGGQIILSDGHEVEVSRRKKDEVLQVINQLLR